MSEYEKRKKLYKQVALYDPQIRKTKNICVKRADFTSEEELEQYCKKLRDDNKAKNADWRRDQRRIKILEKLNGVPLNTNTNTNTNNQIPVVQQVVQIEPIGELEIKQLVEQKALDKQSTSVRLHLDHKTGNTIVIYGSSKRGKSTLMMYLYKKYFMSKDRINTLFSGNPHLRVYKKDKRLLIGYGFNDDSAKYIQMEQFINVRTGNNYKFTNLFDDIIDQKHAPIINKLMLTYRNANISCLVCLQYVYLLSKQNRANVNHTFVFGMNSLEDQKNIIDLVLKPYFVELGLKTFDQQLAFFRAKTHDHGFFYLDNIEGKLSWHRLDLSKK